jgi:hypothetical protein
MKTFEIKLVTTITKTYRIRAKDEEEASELAWEYPPHNHPLTAPVINDVWPPKLGVIRSHAQTRKEWAMEVPYPEEADVPIRRLKKVRSFCAYCGEEGPFEEVIDEAESSGGS